MRPSGSRNIRKTHGSILSTGAKEALHAAAWIKRRLKQMTERTKVHNIEQLLIIASLNAVMKFKN